MYDFRADPALPKAELYSELVAAADALTAGEPDGVANMANVAALLWDMLPQVNWTGFYRMIDGELVLGPFAGRPACIRIPLGRGVCGTAALSGQTQLVEDVHAFPGHIACDSRSESEIVVPVLDASGALIAVFDVDATVKAAFDEQDQVALERLMARVFAAG